MGLSHAFVKRRCSFWLATHFPPNIDMYSHYRASFFLFLLKNWCVIRRVNDWWYRLGFLCYVLKPWAGLLLSDYSSSGSILEFLFAPCTIICYAAISRLSLSRVILIHTLETTPKVLILIFWVSAAWPVFSSSSDTNETWDSTSLNYLSVCDQASFDRLYRYTPLSCARYTLDCSFPVDSFWVCFLHSMHH